MGTLTVSNAVAGTMYFVDASSGNDSNPGTSATSAWQTITKVNAAALTAGDVVLFKRGETFTGMLTPSISGTLVNKIIYGAYGSGIDPIIDNSAGTNALNLTMANYTSCLYFSHIKFIGNSAYYGCLAYTHDTLFEDCEMYNARTGIYFPSGTGDIQPYNNIVRHCVAHDNLKFGIEIGGDGIISDNNLIEYCTCYNNGANTSSDHGIYGHFGVIIRYNTCYSNASAGIKVNDEAYPATTLFPVVYNNICYSNQNGITSAHNHAVIYNNLCYSNNNANMLLDTYPYYNTIVFNTLVNGGGKGMAISTSTNQTFVTIKNNLIIQDYAVVGAYKPYTAQATLSVAQYNTFDYNVYYYDGNAASILISGDVTKTFATWKACTGSPDPNSTLLAAVPGFVSRYTDLHPADGGNLKGLGVAIAGYEYDFDGNLRADPPTPGCYEEAAA